MPRKRLKRNSKGQYKDNDGKAEAIRKYIDAMINVYLDKFPDVSIDDLELFLWHAAPFRFSMRRAFGDDGR
jgi:hypothetical protein